MGLGQWACCRGSRLTTWVIGVVRPLVPSHHQNLTMKTFVGTSGFQYAEWKGSFYPEDLPAAKMLPFYAERFNTTEVNYTFHRIPTPKTIANWCQLTPETFRFTSKAPQKVTHFARLRDCGDTVDYFYDLLSGL